MTYWKIESLKKLLKIERDNEFNKDMTITKNYIKHLETEIQLMEEAYKQGKKDTNKKVKK